MVGCDTAERIGADGREQGRGGVLPRVALAALLWLCAPLAQAEVDLLSGAQWATSHERLSPAEALALDYRVVESPALNLGPRQGWLWLRLRLDGPALDDSAEGEMRWLSVRWPYFRDVRVFLRDPTALPGTAASEWREVREATEIGGLLDMPGHPGRLLPRFDGERELLIRLRADGPAALRLTLGSLEEERANTLVRYTLFGVYLGAMLGMAAYSLFLMLAVRERTYLGYAAFLSATVLYIALRYNILTPWLPEAALAVPPAARAQLAVALMALSGIWFVRRFLRTQRDDRRVDRALVGVMGVALLSMPASIWLAGVLSFAIVATYAVATVVVIVWAALRAMRRGFGPAGYLLLGWSVFALAVLLYLAMLLGWLPYAGWLMVALPVGSLAEALLLAFALGNRIRHKQREETTLARERDRYRFLSEQDGLTGLYNRRALDRRLDLAIAASLRTGTPLSLIVLDTDRFKDYNDRYGHLAGDDALRCLARVMQANVREGDLCFRYGGEEFVILLPGQALAQATVIAERIREAYRGNSASELGPGGTVSLGVAQMREGDTANTLLARADAALYHAKEGGRDRVELAH
ncbi:diguanylate cyclase [Guyparkeria halophila]|uniref:diguanylate cyclase n=1 Tax=Guyparkeria halophila TaxID=47960 RepID=A0A6I6D3C6_9GAMM|nr:GGDEF domain-containing protein [Guyparkeria halophila]QGT79318.1 diguanylate cyclase [Guyparkeria halophila]